MNPHRWRVLWFACLLSLGAVNIGAKDTVGDQRVGISFGWQSTWIIRIAYGRSMDVPGELEWVSELTVPLFAEGFLCNSMIINVDLFDPKLNSLFWQSEQIAPQDHETADYRALMILQNGRQANYHRDPRNPTPWPVWRPGGWVDVWRQHLLGYNPLKNSFHFDFARGASNFPHPVLFMGGTYSALGATYQAEYHAPLFPNGVSVVEIRGTGHRLVVEDPEGVLQAIREYFREYK